MVPSRQEQALVSLGQWLKAEGYAFVTPTPLSHGRVFARFPEARTLRDVFGWSRPFRSHVLPPECLTLLEEAGALTRSPHDPELMRSTVRFSSLAGLEGERPGLVVHSAWPTSEADAVFFGPDTYRYTRFLRALYRELSRPFRRAVDVGAGSGAGLLSIATACDERWLTDINPRALSFARVNAALWNVDVQLVQGSLLDSAPGTFDLIACNPPFLVDDAERAYRHGGGARGIEFSVRMVNAAIPKLGPDGVLALYTCTPIVDGRDLLREALQPLLSDFRGEVRYEEVDPDVYGEELERPAYADVERLSIVCLTATRTTRPSVHD